MWSNEQKHNEIKRVIQLYNRVEKLISRKTIIRRIVDTVVLTLSVLTSGTLWVLSTTKAPEIFAWIGAIISSVVTLMMMFQLSARLPQLSIELKFLHHDLGQYIAILREADERPNDFWLEVKEFESQIIDYEN